MDRVSFHTTRTEHDLIDQIVDRALAMAVRQEIKIERMELTMDITATHCNGCRLKLHELLGAEPFDFSHDIFGIRRHVSRETGKLGDCFLPRYAA